MNHKNLHDMRDANMSHRPWKPGFAFLPSGAHVDTKVLREATDTKLFNEMFGVTGESIDEFTRKLIRVGYAAAADLTTVFINRIIQK